LCGIWFHLSCLGEVPLSSSLDPFLYIYINIKYVYVYTYGSLFGPYHVINMYKSKGKFRGQEWTHLMAPSKVLALWDAVPRLIEGKDAAANASHTASWKILEAQVSLAI
jgi:hypothetical protein